MNKPAEVPAEAAYTWIGAGIPYVLPFCIAVLAIALTNPGTLVVILTDGFWPAAIVLGAAGWGAWPAKWLLRDAKNFWQQCAAAAAIGFGVMAVLTLSLGVFGLLSRPAAWLLIGVGIAFGIWRLALSTGEGSRVGRTVGPGEADPTTRYRWVIRIAALLPLGVPIYVALCGAAIPPGILWRDEAGGYDVLEYHLQVQREYFEQGRIAFLAHNVYASFPQQVEIFYLLLMHLEGDAVQAAIPAQLFHVLLGGLAVAAFAAWLPPGWPRLCGAVTMGCTPWLGYLGCIAYVENGMLFFASITFGILADWVRGERPAPGAALAAGLCAGMAGGCKYTAIVFVGAMGAVCALVFVRDTFARRCRLIGLFLIALLVGVSPWLVRNTAFTGNPVYPFAYSMFGGNGWSEGQAAQWSRGHAVSTGRITVAWREFFLGKFGGREQTQFFATLFGVLPLGIVFGLIVLCSRPPTARLVAFWLTLAILMLVTWAASTQVAGRLAVAVVIPLSALVASLVARHQKTGTIAAFLVAVIGSAILYGTWSHADRDLRRRVGVSLGELAGQSDLFVRNHPYNAVLPIDARLWLVGDAAVLYVQRRMRYFTAFNRDSWLEFSSNVEPSASVMWLRERGITHVVFNWGEIERLRRTYGFSDRASREWERELERAGLRPIAIPAEWLTSLKGIDIYSVTTDQSTSPVSGPTNLSGISGSNMLARVRSED